ncbi:hypothetical protein CDL15_Pgr007640 [Punica granatum]|nr:hypothetical protein CDL15_Pgr007640 [Punica granatum]PKI40981.1 hypothetical protein CRG98_038509 [Punica granatum]
MARQIRVVVIFIYLAIFFKVSLARTYSRASIQQEVTNYCLSWRLAVEANNVRAWRTVPMRCLRYVETYMMGGQYEKDLELIMDQVLSYANSIDVAKDGMDAWILDIDDTCISNVLYYKEKRYGCDPFDVAGFKSWATKGQCPAIRPVLRLFNKLINGGFKVILLTGRDNETLGQCTINNVQSQGFVGYERLVMRTAAYKGQSAATYKSEIRRQLVEEGYRIWGNVGDQWSDLQGDFPGNRTFKLPNPMYFVP